MYHYYLTFFNLINAVLYCIPKADLRGFSVYVLITETSILFYRNKIIKTDSAKVQTKKKRIFETFDRGKEAQNRIVVCIKRDM